MYKFIASFFFLLLCWSVNAQKGDKIITGKIVDSLSLQPLEYATITLFRLDSNKVVDGATTDDKGVFEIKNVKEDTYKAIVSFIGYSNKTINTIHFNSSDLKIDLGEIRLGNMAVNLKEVDIVINKSIIENKIDKLVYNADKDVTTQGGVATDILKKVPMVSVNSDGTVELLGNSNIRFLINGKPSTVFGSNITDVLQTIPASQIQTIEVITSPGAKYDAEGTGGIINIILKKATVKGINGNVSLTGGTRLQNGSFNLTYRKGSFGVNTYLSGNAQIATTTLNTMNRISNDPSGSSSQLLQDGNSKFTRNGYQSGLSFDWDINETNSLTGGFSYNNLGNNTNGTTQRQSILNDSLGNTVSNNFNSVLGTNNLKSNDLDWNLNYKKKFKKDGQELEVTYSSSLSNNYSYYKQTQQFLNSDLIYSGAYGKNPGSDFQTNISVNYTHPVSEKLLFEGGVKSVLYEINSQSNVYLYKPTSEDYNFSKAQSNLVNYGRNVYAGFLSSTMKFKFFDVMIGIRNEYTQTTKAQFSNASNIVISPYNTVVPSGVISHTFKKNQILKLSYSYRIQRPDYSDLNPFVNASDPKNVSTGNPFLKPETSHRIELGYNKSFEKGININVNAFYRGNRADIQTYTRYYSSYLIGDSTYYNLAVSTRENIGREDNYGLNLYGSAVIKKKINLRSNMAFFQRYIFNSINPGMNIHGFNYRINLNASYQISKTFMVEIFGNFNSSRINVQGIMPSFTTYNFAIRKQFLNNKMSIAFTTTNPFNKYVNQRTKTTGVNFYSNSLRALPYRSFGLNLTWKFGKLEFKKQKEMEDYNLTNPPSGD